MRAESGLDDVAAQVKAALGCELEYIDREVHTRGARVLQGEVLGLKVTLSEWPPRGNVDPPAFQLHGVPRDPAGSAATEDIDISEYVCALLKARGAGLWHKPTEDEIDEEVRFAEELDPDD